MWIKVIEVMLLVLNVLSSVQSDRTALSLIQWFEQLSAWKAVFYLTGLGLIICLIIEVWMARSESKQQMTILSQQLDTVRAEVREARERAMETARLLTTYFNKP